MFLHLIKHFAKNNAIVSNYNFEQNFVLEFNTKKKLKNNSRGQKNSNYPYQFFHIDTRLSNSYEDIGSFRLGKLFKLFGYCYEALKFRLIYGVKSVYMIPAPPRRSALYRDWILLLFFKILFKKIVFHWHGIGLGDWLKNSANFAERFFTKFLFNNIYQHIVLSNACIDDISVFNPKRVEIIFNGIKDPLKKSSDDLINARKLNLKNRLTAINQKKITGKKSANFKILFMSQCSKDKGLFASIKAFKLFKQILADEKIPIKTELHVAGKFALTSEQDKFNKILLEKNDGMFFHGFVSSKAKHELLLSSDLISFPSLYQYEGQPLILIEALAYALPIVATHWRDIPNIAHPKHSILLENQDETKLARAYYNAMLMENFSDSRKKFLNYFTIKTHVRNMESLLQRII